MTANATLMRDASRTKWGLAAFHVAAGSMLLLFSLGGGLTMADQIACFLLIALGAGLAMHVAIARWFALGLCYLYILVALLLPPQMFLLRPVTAEGALRVNLLFTAVAFAFGNMGYVGLRYYRSELGRFEYRRDRTTDEIPPPENPLHTLLSTVAWLVVIVMMQSFGMSTPTWLLQPFEARSEPRASVPAAPQPLIQPVGLCRTGEADVSFLYRYTGPAAPGSAFTVDYNLSILNSMRRLQATAKLPPRGGVGRVDLGRVEGIEQQRQFSDDLVIYTDLEQRVDPTRNPVIYKMSRGIMSTLPACDPAK